MSDFTVFDIETNGRAPWSSRLLCAGIGDKAHTRGAEQAIAKLFARPGVIVEHTMFDARWALMSGAELGPATEVHDIRTLAWLDREEVPGDLQPFRLENLMKRYLGEDIKKPIGRLDGVVTWDCDIIPVPGRKGRIPIDDVPIEMVAEYNLADLDEEGRLYEHLRDRLDMAGLWDLYLDKEVELGIALVHMEATGLPFDSRACDKLRAKVAAEAGDVAALLVDELGVPANLGSPAQMAALLFTPKGKRVELKGRVPLSDSMREHLKGVKREDKLRIIAQTRELPATFEPRGVGTGYVTGVWVGKGRGLVPPEPDFGASHSKAKADDDKPKRPSTASIPLVLANPSDAFVSDFVFWRELDKLDSVFLAKFPSYVHEGRLHGLTNRTGTTTGRFSSSEPNLQSIPAHGTYGAAVRGLFSGKLALGDYAQLEQRIAAHFCLDPVLVKAYQDNVDLYGLAASILFGGEPVKKHPKRGLMKTGVLSLQYGAGSKKLSQLMRIDGHKMDDGRDPEPEDAKELIDQLREVLPVFFAWRDELVEQAIRDGGIRTLSGRYRRLDFPTGWERHRKRNPRRFYGEEIAGRGFLAERQAINSKCQGGAADIVAGAMVAVWLEMRGKLRMLVQVHDEVVWERLPAWRSSMLPKLRELCEVGHGYDLNVPLVFEAQEARSWAEKGAGASGASSMLRERAIRDRDARKSEGLQSRKASQFGAEERRARLEARKAKSNV